MKAVSQQQSPTNRAKREARVFIEGLVERLVELQEMAELAKQFQAFEKKEYARFKRLFLNFTGRTEEFQLLSALTEETLKIIERFGSEYWKEHQDLGDYFRKLQIAMLQRTISTQLRLLRVWEDRWNRGEGLPYGSGEIFIEALRVIGNAKAQLIRPRYVSMVDGQTLTDAENALHLMRVLIRNAPKYDNFNTDADAGVLAGGSQGRRSSDEPFLPGLEATLEWPDDKRRML